MEIKIGERYKIHFMGSEALIDKVKVTNIYNKADGSIWIEWRYNMPFPIYVVDTVEDFQSWVLNPIK